jgi:hypothetical protein
VGTGSKTHSRRTQARQVASSSKTECEGRGVVMGGGVTMDDLPTIRFPPKHGRHPHDKGHQLCAAANTRSMRVQRRRTPIQPLRMVRPLLVSHRAGLHLVLALRYWHHDVLVGGSRPHDVGLTGVMIGREDGLVQFLRQQEHDVRR